MKRQERFQKRGYPLSVEVDCASRAFSSAARPVGETMSDGLGSPKKPEPPSWPGAEDFNTMSWCIVELREIAQVNTIFIVGTAGTICRSLCMRLRECAKFLKMCASAARGATARPRAKIATGHRDALPPRKIPLLSARFRVSAPTNQGRGGKQA